ncbi:MAG: PhzF family phenazine biosynthesis protein [Planctomycetota bacterium]
MRVPMYQVDAFADTAFNGNPAAVVLLEEELPAAVMQAIAAENNQSETAFVLGANGTRTIRWFTPIIEVDLCGHGTLAAGHVLFSTDRHDNEHVEFTSKSGPLSVTRTAHCLWLDFPADILTQANDLRPMLSEALGAPVQSVLHGRTDLLAILPDADTVARLHPDMSMLAQIDCRGVIASARGDDCDFVSRFFAPSCGIPEDPVTGSAHTSLAPYWYDVLGKRELHARQLSPRQGVLRCRCQDDRVHIGGQAVTYLEGMITI